MNWIGKMDFWQMFKDSAKANFEITILVIALCIAGVFWGNSRFATADEMDVKISAALAPISQQVQSNGTSITDLKIDAYERERRNLTRQVTQIEAVIAQGIAEPWQLTVLADLKSDVITITENIERESPQ